MPMGFTGHVRAPNKDFLQGSRRRQARGAANRTANGLRRRRGTAARKGGYRRLRTKGSAVPAGISRDRRRRGCLLEGRLDHDDSLSEEYTLSCGRNGGCNGDDNVNVLQWAKATGLADTADYGPYKASPGWCNWKAGMKLYKIDDWGFADSSQGQGVTDTTAIKMRSYSTVASAPAWPPAATHSGTVGPASAQARRTTSTMT